MEYKVSYEFKKYVKKNKWLLKYFEAENKVDNEEELKSEKKLTNDNNNKENINNVENKNEENKELSGIDLEGLRELDDLILGVNSDKDKQQQEKTVNDDEEKEEKKINENNENKEESYENDGGNLKSEEELDNVNKGDINNEEIKEDSLEQEQLPQSHYETEDNEKEYTAKGEINSDDNKTNTEENKVKKEGIKEKILGFIKNPENKNKLMLGIGGLLLAIGGISMYLNQIPDNGTASEEKKKLVSNKNNTTKLKENKGVETKKEGKKQGDKEVVISNNKEKEKEFLDSVLKVISDGLSKQYKFNIYTDSKGNELISLGMFIYKIDTYKQDAKTKQKVKEYVRKILSYGDEDIKKIKLAWFTDMKVKLDNEKLKEVCNMYFKGKINCDGDLTKKKNLIKIAEKEYENRMKYYKKFGVQIYVKIPKYVVLQNEQGDLYSFNDIIKDKISVFYTKLNAKSIGMLEGYLGEKGIFNNQMAQPFSPLYRKKLLKNMSKIYTQMLKIAKDDPKNKQYKIGLLYFKLFVYAIKNTKNMY